MTVRSVLRLLAPRNVRITRALYRSKPAWESLGWVRSNDEMMSVDREGRPLPWYSYPAIDFLQQRDLSALDVFEFGMGNSTLWWADRAKSVVACEGDQRWFDRIKPSIPPNVEALLHDQASEDYVSAASSHTFDVLVIDGRRRVECARCSIGQLRPAGVVIWDNADRERYSEGYRLLGNAGFRRIDFFGFGPLTYQPWSTAIFYRDGNCFGI